MENYIILHNYFDKNLIYLNPKFIESITTISKENPGGTLIFCTGRDTRYWVAENVEEVRKKIWGTI